MGIEATKRKKELSLGDFLELQERVLGSARGRGTFGSVELNPFEKALEEVTGKGTIIEGQTPVRTLKELIEGPTGRPVPTRGGIPSPEFLLPPRTRQNTISSLPTYPVKAGNYLDRAVSMDNVGREKVISTLTGRILNDFTLEQIVDARRASGEVDKGFKSDMNFLHETYGGRLTKEKIKRFFAGSLARSIIGVDIQGEKL
jgi:hypothetical protein